MIWTHFNNIDLGFTFDWNSDSLNSDSLNSDSLNSDSLNSDSLNSDCLNSDCLNSDSFQFCIIFMNVLPEQAQYAEPVFEWSVAQKRGSSFLYCVLIDPISGTQEGFQLSLLCISWSNQWHKRGVAAIFTVY